MQWVLTLPGCNFLAVQLCCISSVFTLDFSILLAIGWSSKGAICHVSFWSRRDLQKRKMQKNHRTTPSALSATMYGFNSLVYVESSMRSSSNKQALQDSGLWWSRMRLRAPLLALCLWRQAVSSPSPWWWTLPCHWSDSPYRGCSTTGLLGKWQDGSLRRQRKPGVLDTCRFAMNSSQPYTDCRWHIRAKSFGDPWKIWMKMFAAWSRTDSFPDGGRVTRTRPAWMCSSFSCWEKSCQINSPGLSCSSTCCSTARFSLLVPGPLVTGCPNLSTSPLWSLGGQRDWK